MQKNHRVAIVGCGIWGRNIVRNFYNLSVLDTVCDIDKENRENVLKEYEGVKVTDNFEKILNNPEITSVAVVTPSHTHFEMVKKVLEAGKNVYVEKPLATNAQQACILNEIAHKKGLVLMVGHLLLYHPAVNRLKMLVDSGDLGEIIYVQSDRLNVNYFKNDRSVMWDLAPHDVSMTSYIVSQKPKRVISATGTSCENNNILDITHLTLEYEKGTIVHISDSWIHPQKRVNLLVRGTKATAVFDDTFSENKLRIYDNKKPAQVYVENLDYIEIEPLKLECQHFLSCIERGKSPRSDGENGFDVVSVLQTCENIMLGEKVKSVDEFNFVVSRSKR